jgi:HEAT repeat protein
MKLTKSLLVVLAGAVWAVAGQAADYAAAVDALIPRMADADVPARYPAQMELQKLASEASAPGHAAERRALGQVLAERVADESQPQPARVWMVRQLQYMGREEAVPALAGLLTNDDAQLRECARRALEQNPSRAAETTLLKALQRGGDVTWRLGLIRSLGVRRCARAVPLLAKALHDPDTTHAAAAALGRIATPEALVELERALNTSPFVAEALVQAAHESVSPETARKLYRTLYTRCVFALPHAAALVGWAGVDPEGAWASVAQALDNMDPRLRRAALNAAEALGEDGMALLVARLPDLAPEMRAQLVGRLNTVAEPALIGALNDPADPVRLMAIKRLGEVGTAEAVPALLAVMNDSLRPGAREALTALVRLRGMDAARAIAQAAGAADPLTVAALQVLTARQCAGALPLFVKQAQSQNQEVAVAALDGLAKLGGDDELLPVARLAVERNNPAAWRALPKIAARVKDGETAARSLIELANGSEATLLRLLDVLGTLGGPDALEVVGGFAKGAHAEAALHALARWPDLSSVSLLAGCAGDHALSAALRALALSGVLDLVSEHDTAPADQRADALLAVLKTAPGPAEQKRILAAMGQVPSAKLAAALKPFLKQKDVQAEAVMAAAGLAEKLAQTDPAAAADLAKAALATKPPAPVAKRLKKLLK